jgi:hypothetical protein
VPAWCARRRGTRRPTSTPARVGRTPAAPARFRWPDRYCSARRRRPRARARPEPRTRCERASQKIAAGDQRRVPGADAAIASLLVPVRLAPENACVGYDRRAHQPDGHVRHMRRDPAREVDVGDRAVVGPEPFRDTGEGTAPAARRVDQRLASHHRTGKGCALIGSVPESEGEQVTDRRRHGEEPGGVHRLHGGDRWPFPPCARLTRPPRPSANGCYRWWARRDDLTCGNRSRTSR